MKKIAILTTTRAEYGLLCPLIQRMQTDNAFDVDIIVSGTHLLEKYGNTVKYIQDDNINIAYKVNIYREDFGSTEKEASESVAEGLKAFAGIFEKERYSAVLVLGDRYELLSFCVAAILFRIPIIHLHGGEITEGAVDDKIRHAITKMASIHFPSLDSNAKRILQMGEDPKYVYPVGALGIDNIVNFELIPKMDLYQELGIPEGRTVAAVTFHPVTGEDKKCASEETKTVMEALLESGIYSIVTMPNSDVGGEEVYNVILEYKEKHPDSFSLHKSLGQKRYLSLLAAVDIMVGNSSSGIIESASFRLPTVNIGDRQKGREAPLNVIHCSCSKEKILEAIHLGTSDVFKDGLKGYINPYGDGNTARKIVDILKGIDFHDVSLIQKKFWQIDWNGYYGE